MFLYTWQINILKWNKPKKKKKKAEASSPRLVATTGISRTLENPALKEPI